MNVRFLEEKNSTNKMEITIDLGSNMEKSVAISSETLEENDLSNPELRNYMKLYDLLEPSDVNHRFLSGTDVDQKVVDQLEAFINVDDEENRSQRNPYHKYEEELIKAVENFQTLHNGLAASEDEIFDFFQGVLDGNCEGEMFLVLCDFVCEFIKAHEVDEIVLTDVRVQAKEHLDTIIYTHQNFTSSMKAQALEKLRATEDPAAVASDFGLKSPWTILYWKNQRDEQESLEKIQLLSPHRATPSTGRKRELVQEQELLDWILSQKDGSLTKQDIITHMMESYPKFVSAKSYAALKIWVLRFLKRHISRAGLPNPDMMAAANPAAVGVEARDSNHNNSNGISVGRSTNTKDRVSTGSNELSSATRTLSRKRKASSNRYMIHSNEFKLHALEMLDQGKTIAEVSEALGLKSPNTLVYWNSIRDKLETAEKKRYRLHGGGRKSSCPFESDLLAWVSERHAKGYETDVKTLLDHLIKNHPSFVEGKKEPTIRKWILRFFKRFMKTTVCGPITTGSRQIGERSSKQKEGVESQDSNEVEDIMEVNLSTNKSPIGAMVTEDQIFL